MKINNIQSTFAIKQRGNILNPAKIQEVKYDVLDISFKGKRVKHSKDFLEITKTNKDLRSFITQACLLDKDGKFSQEKEDFFYKTYNSLKDGYKDERDALLSSAISIKVSNDLYGISDHASMLSATIKMLIEKGFSRHDILQIFEPEDFDKNMLLKMQSPESYIRGMVSQVSISDTLNEKEASRVSTYAPFDFAKPYGFEFLRNILDELNSRPGAVRKPCSFEEMNFFLLKYCKNINNNQTDIKRIPQLVLLFDALGVNTLFHADALFELTLNDDRSFNSDICDFMRETIETLWANIRNDKNSMSFVMQNLDYAKSTVISMFPNLIDVYILPDGKFDKEGAMDTFKEWLTYALENKDVINRAVKAQIEAEDADQVGEIFDEVCNNDFYRITWAIANFDGDILH